MSFDYTRTAFKLAQIKHLFENEELIVDTSYQRRKVWVPQDNIRLIETILLGYIIPELFFWDAETDPDTGKTLTHIVDGQQRVNAIFDFAEGKFSLKRDLLITEGAKEGFGDRKFSDFTDKEKVAFWNYEISVVQIKKETIDRIKMMFYRLNLTNYDLNEQEKRHGTTWGKFADLSQELVENPFWDEYKLFNANDIRRMKDVEFCSSLILLARKGIINQTDQKPLNNAYHDYSEEYEEYDEDKVEIIGWMESLKEIISESNIKFFRKKSQLYTSFTLIRFMKMKDIPIDATIIERFNQFVKDYSEFKNDTGTIIEENSYTGTIQKYKLASSEGINKLRNRNIRFKILKEIVLEMK